jgi:hypothetical protein
MMKMLSRGEVIYSEDYSGAGENREGGYINECNGSVNDNRIWWNCLFQAFRLFQLS